MKWFKLSLGMLLTGFGIYHAGHNMHVTDFWMLYRLYLGVMMVLIGGQYTFSPNAGLDSFLNPFHENGVFGAWFVFVCCIFIIPLSLLRLDGLVYHWAFLHPVPWWVGIVGTLSLLVCSATIALASLMTLGMLRNDLD